MRRSDLIVVLATLLTAGEARAQAQSCAIPSHVPLPALPDQKGQASVRTQVTGYLLALSWSPEFCRARYDARHRLQCSGEMGRFGFILHGLWPEGPEGRDPRWCRSVPLPDMATLRNNLCITPSTDLLAYEWAKHGSCRFADAPRYFRAGRALFDAVRFPDMNALSKRNPRAVDVRRAFASANHGLPVDAVAIVANRRQWLQEVRLCLGIDFRPRDCGRGDRGAEDDVPIRIWRDR